MKTRKLPETDSIKELAEFWDSHDLTDFEDQLEEVETEIFDRRPATALEVRLLPQELQAVKQIARARGIEHSALIREWVLEKLHAAQASNA